MSNLNDTYTTVSGLKGTFRVITTRPGDEDAAGLQAGDIYIDSTNKKIGIYDGSKWAERVLTTTSTSTSTSTSTTTTA